MIGVSSVSSVNRVRRVRSVLAWGGASVPAPAPPPMTSMRQCVSSSKLADWLARSSDSRHAAPGSVPATACDRGCSRMRSRLQPHAIEAATACGRGCNRMRPGLQP